MKTQEELKLIYVVTTLYAKEDEFDITRRRSPGFFYKEEDAERCIKENWGDIYEEMYYNLAIIEPFEEGLYAVVDKIRWFRVERIEQEYKITEIETPKGYQQILGFSLG